METADGESSIKEELASLPYGELMKLQNKLGTKRFNEAYSSKPGNTGKKNFKRENKNRPMEVSSKRKVRNVNAASASRKIHDPRFDERTGEFKESLFKQSYSFIGDIQQNEREKMAKQLKKEKREDRKVELKKELDVMIQKEKVVQQKKLKSDIEKAVKRDEKAKVAKGKTPFYAKKSQIKTMELTEKYKELKKSGKLEQFLRKKRKKNAAKDRKKAPELHI